MEVALLKRESALNHVGSVDFTDVAFWNGPGNMKKISQCSGCCLFDWCLSSQCSHNLLSAISFFNFAAVAASAPRKSLGSTAATNSASSSSAASTPCQSTRVAQLTIDFEKLIEVKIEVSLSLFLSLCFTFNPQQRTSMLVATPCVSVPPPPGRKASGTFSVVPQESLRKRTRDPRRWMMAKRPVAVGCQRPTGSMLVIQILRAT